MVASESRLTGFNRALGYGVIISIIGFIAGFLYARHNIGPVVFTWKSWLVAITLTVDVAYSIGYAIVTALHVRRGTVIGKNSFIMLVVSMISLSGAYLLGVYLIYDGAINCGRPLASYAISCKELLFLSLSQLPLIILVVVSVTVFFMAVTRIKIALEEDVDEDEGV